MDKLTLFSFGLLLSVAIISPVVAGGNSSVTSQSGDNNVSSTSQSGTGNSSNTSQSGSANSASTSQSGSRNESTTSQSGSRHESRTSQRGDRNTARSEQYGNRNKSRISQRGSRNWAYTLQYGSRNVARIAQLGRGNSAAIGQDGVGNFASIRQYGGKLGPRPRIPGYGGIRVKGKRYPLKSFRQIYRTNIALRCTVTEYLHSSGLYMLSIKTGGGCSGAPISFCQRSSTSAKRFTCTAVKNRASVGL